MSIVEISTVKREVAAGDFDCPTCGRPQPYLHLRARRVVRACGVPLPPSAPPVDSLECRGCDASFDPSVLETSGDERGRVAAVHERAMLYAMAATALARDGAARARTERIPEVFVGLAGAELDAGQLQAALRAVEGRPFRIWGYLRDLAPRLNEVGKQRVVHAALFVAASDGRLDRSGVRQVRRVARALELSTTSLSGTVAAVRRGNGTPFARVLRRGGRARPPARPSPRSATDVEARTTSDRQTPALR